MRQLVQAGHVHLLIATCFVILLVGASEVDIPGYSSLVSLPALNSSITRHSIAFPATIFTVFVTINACSSSLAPNIFLSLDDTITDPTADDLGDTRRNLTSGGLVPPGTEKRFYGNWKSKDNNVYQIVMEKGFGNWTGRMENGGWMSVEMPVDDDGNVLDGSGDIEIDLGASVTSPIHSVSKTSVQLGDTTSSQALLLSPLIKPYSLPQPKYPNYTLPQAELDWTSYPFPDGVRTANVTSILIPTESSPTLQGLDYSLCAVRRAVQATGEVGRNSTSFDAIWKPGGFRCMAITSGLQSDTNYTAWFVEEDVGEGDGGRLSGPIMLATKPASFPCPLVHSLDICPGVTYAAPLIGPEDGSPVTNLPDEYSDLLVSNLRSFSTSLLSSACGRDLYSHVSSCADCYDSYRDWLCRTVLPQCTVASTSANSTIQTITRSPAVTRIEGLPNPPYEYTQLKPCLSVCNTADRDCPAFLEFRCPIRGVTADKSYAYQGDDDEDEGLDGTGFYDGGTNQWGERWCNGPVPKDA